MNLAIFSFFRSLLIGAVALSANAVAAADRTEALLAELADAPGPPGFEEAVRAVVVRELKPLADKISYDGLGSVIAQHGASGPRIMLDAHMDELGGVVRRVTPQGFLTMQMLGGWLDQALPDQRWVIIGSKGPVKAVTGIRDIHVVPAEERSKVYSRDTMFLDVGARNAADVAALGLGPGDPVVPDAPFEVLANQRYLGKAWDDRVGLAVVIEALRRLQASGHPNQLFIAATVQEEVGLRGARTAAHIIQPDIGIAIEGGITGDSPGRNPEETQAVLGGGPGIFLYDSSAIPNRKLVALVKTSAAGLGIPLQLDLVQGYGDDSAEIQKTGGGVPTVNLVVPARYTHAHNGIIDRKDFDGMVDLVVRLVERLDAATVRRSAIFRARRDGAIFRADRNAGMVAAILVAVALFVGLGVAVGAGLTVAFDSAVLLVVREPGDLSVPRGPRWLFAAMRDITALGDSPVLTLVTAIGAGYALSRRRVAEAVFIAFTAASGAFIDTQLKLLYGRPRPDLTPHLVEVISPSFPSGHAMNSAIIYLTLCALLVRHTTGRRSRTYIAVVGVALAAIIGASRAYLGVHYPTDIIAGWAAGIAWALTCWLVAARLVPVLAPPRNRSDLGGGVGGRALPSAVQPAKARRP